MARIWEEANKRLSVEKPEVEKEIAGIETKMHRTRTAMDRYFAAFESGDPWKRFSRYKGKTGICGLPARHS
jgi:hypothetical protein